jgi:hypothetical protein
MNAGMGQPPVRPSSHRGMNRGLYPLGYRPLPFPSFYAMVWAAFAKVRAPAARKTEDRADLAQMTVRTEKIVEFHLQTGRPIWYKGYCNDLWVFIARRRVYGPADHEYFWSVRGLTEVVLPHTQTGRHTSHILAHI